MADHPSVADWITAISTAATAIAAAIAGFIAWISFRRDTKSSLPTIEAEIRWSATNEGEAYILLILLIRNPLWETVILESARVRQPAGTLISDKYKTEGGGRLVPIIKGESSYTEIGRQVSSFGSTSDLFSPGMPRRSDIYRHEIYLLPPINWLGGKVRVDLRISSKALTIRHKRIVIKRRINPRPARQTEEKANNHGAVIPQ